jgi:hypothetical protein
MIVLDHKIAKSIVQSPKIIKHAKERALERYGMDASAFGDYVMKNHRRFEFVSLTYGYEGQVGRMFVCDGKTFILDYSENIIVTTYPCDDKKLTKDAERYRNKLSKITQLFVDKEVSRIEREEARLIRKLQRYIAEIEAEVSDLRRTMSFARSSAKILSLKSRIAAFEIRLAEMPTEEANIRIKKMRKLQALMQVVYGKVEGAATYL